MCGKLCLPKSNPVFALLSLEKWDKAAKEARKTPSYAKESFKVKGFYDNDVAPKINALQLACGLQGPTEVIEVLGSVYPAACAQADSKYQRLALHVATMNGSSPKTVNALLKLDAKTASKADIHGRLPLHYACKDSLNGLQNVRVLLKVFPEAARTPDNNGFLPLHVACLSGASPQLIRMLIRAAPESIFFKTEKGGTPVSCARRSKGDAQDEVIGLLQRLAEEVDYQVGGDKASRDGSFSTSMTGSVGSSQMIMSR